MASLLRNQIARQAAAINGSTRRGLRAEGLASVLAIGTANPPNCVRQEDYADYYFRVTKSEHLCDDLKDKLKRICNKSAISKRYFHHTEELLGRHPELTSRKCPSLDTRQDILGTSVPELAAAAAAKAIAEWGRPATEITDLVVSSFSGAHMPGVDFHLANLLGLRPSVRRTMLYMNGCFGGSAALRVAKDIAENNRGARVLVASADLTLVFFRAPDETHADTETLVMQALFGDGAGAVVVGADPVSGERPEFEMVSASQTTMPESGHVAQGRIREDGFVFHPSKEMPSLVRENIERCVADALAPTPMGAFTSWNELFWVVHPGGPAILDSLEAGLGLDPRKLEASRRVLREYGNMSGPSVIFVLDELRRQQEEMNEMGVMVGLGPGLTVETMALRATSRPTN
ncbi:hypothetical protein HU200_044339 [Digitaria exilis]|uniref:Uncharacterized protein n=1 Tax=Digitaria exilis TaxID=1010633 RepID=A0A835ED51_9POAL|nr:hypothetical protein HU200_044339 [Digitaria exilis]CAB3493729.1 unnamed protein product [Digitaria exilis]